MLGNSVADCYRRKWIGKTTVILPEEQVEGCWEGYSPEYLRVRLNPDTTCSAGIPVSVFIRDISPRYLGGVKINHSEVD